MKQTGPQPSKAWYLVAIVLAVAGFIGGSVMIWRAFVAISGVEQFLGPGRFAVQVVAPGNYMLWHDYKAVFKGRAYAVKKSLPDGVRFRVTGPGGGVPGASSGVETTTIGETERVAVASFAASAPGDYEIFVEGEFPTRVFSVGPDNFVKSFVMIFGGIGVILLAFSAGTVLGIWVYFKRDTAKAPVEIKGGSTMSATEGTPEHSARQLTTIVYALQAASFLVGITFIAAAIVNYIKRDEVAGTWLESHFLWQIRTFWWSLLWGILGMILMLVVVGFFILIADAIWVLYRIVKGWLNLNDGKAMYEPKKRR